MRDRWTLGVIERWQKWRNEDHMDNAVISRSDVIAFLTEIEVLRSELEYERKMHAETQTILRNAKFSLEKLLKC